MDLSRWRGSGRRIQSAMTMAWELTTWRHWADELMLVSALMMGLLVSWLEAEMSGCDTMRCDALRCDAWSRLLDLELSAARHHARTLKAQSVQIDLQLAQRVRAVARCQAMNRMLGRKAVRFLKFCQLRLRSKLPELLSRKVQRCIREFNAHLVPPFDTLPAPVVCIIELAMSGYEHQPKVGFQTIPENDFLVYEKWLTETAETAYGHRW